MRSAIITRRPSHDYGTFGLSLTDTGVGFISLELPWRNNERNMSSIPEGTYKCVLTFMPKFNEKMYMLEDVPGRTEIFIHPFNLAGDADKGFKTESAGCIGLGLKEGEISCQRAILSSKAAVKKLITEMKGESFMLTIKNGV